MASVTDTLARAAANLEVAHGAWQQALERVRGGAAGATQDPYVLRALGEVCTHVRAAEALLNLARQGGAEAALLAVLAEAQCLDAATRAGQWLQATGGNALAVDGSVQAQGQRLRRVGDYLLNGVGL